jgi:hypothetical protein
MIHISDGGVASIDIFTCTWQWGVRYLNSDGMPAAALRRRQSLLDPVLKAGWDVRTACAVLVPLPTRLCVCQGYSGKQWPAMLSLLSVVPRRAMLCLQTQGHCHCSKPKLDPTGTTGCAAMLSTAAASGWHYQRRGRSDRMNKADAHLPRNQRSCQLCSADVATSCTRLG